MITSDLTHAQKRFTEEITILNRLGDLVISFQDHFDDDNQWMIFKKKAMDIASGSLLYISDFFEEFLEDNRENELPNSSSGSFLTAITDREAVMDFWDNLAYNGEVLDMEWAEEYADRNLEYN